MFSPTNKNKKVTLMGTAGCLLVLIILSQSVQLSSASKSCDPSAIMGFYLNSCRFRRGHQEAGNPFRLWRSQMKETFAKDDNGSGSRLSYDVDEIAEEEIIGILTQGIYFVEKEETENHNNRNSIRRMDNSKRLLRRQNAHSAVFKCCSGPTGCKAEDFSHLC